MKIKISKLPYDEWKQKRNLAAAKLAKSGTKESEKNPNDR